MQLALQSPTMQKPEAFAATSAGATERTSTITASNFLTLLVTELKNQDPTKPTDPSEYVQQIVGVNSLEQLIQINNQLSGRTADTSAAAQQIAANSR